MDILVDLKDHLENNLGVNVYPMHIPQGSDLPAIQASVIDYSRDTNSNLAESNIERYRIQINYVAKTTLDVLDNLKTIVDMLEGYSGTMGTTNILTARVQNTVPLYDEKQTTFEYAVDVIFTVLK